MLIVLKIMEKYKKKIALAKNAHRKKKSSTRPDKKKKFFFFEISGEFFGGFF